MDLLHCLRRIPHVDVGTNVPMSQHTSFGIGGPADILVIPHTIEALAQAVKAVYAAGEEPMVMGNGTNMLVLDGGVRGVVIKVCNGLSRVTAHDDLVTAESGVRVASLCCTCADFGLSGLEWAAGIPGALGGALTMNAGANGGEVGQFVEWVRVVRPDGSIEKLSRAQLAFGYRYSSFQGIKAVIAQACLRLHPCDPVIIRERMCAVLEERCEKQPVAMPSAGCVFKRPKNDYAGRLLEEVGAKGLRVGGAVVSEKHANFIVNDGGATAADVLELIDLARTKVWDVFGVDLVPEVCVRGEPLPGQVRLNPDFSAMALAHGAGV